MTTSGVKKKGFKEWFITVVCGWTRTMWVTNKNSCYGWIRTKTVLCEWLIKIVIMVEKKLFKKFISFWTQEKRIVCYGKNCSLRVKEYKKPDIYEWYWNIFIWVKVYENCLLIVL